MPHSGQMAVRRAAKRFNWLCAGRRWRKTTLCMSIACEAAVRGAQIIWGAPVYEQSRTGFDELHRAAWSVATFNQSRMIATFPSGGTVLFRSLDNPDNVRSKTADGIIIDEIQHVNPDAYQQVLRPMLIDTGGWLWAIGTSNGHDWFYRERQQARTQDDAAVWKAPTLGVTIQGDKLVRSPHPLENDAIAFAEVESLFYSLPRHIFRREIVSDDDAVSGLLVYEEWLDDYPERKDGNVTIKAEYIPGAGAVYWAVDDGYAGMVDRLTGEFTGDSHPRVFCLFQLRGNGDLCMFYESAKIKALSDEHISEVLNDCKEKGYPLPEFAVVDKSAAELKGRLNALGIYTRNGPASVDESVKELRNWIAPDKNGHRRLLVHPRCKHARYEFANYQRDQDTGKIIKAFDHETDATRYLAHVLRYER